MGFWLFFEGTRTVIMGKKSSNKRNYIYGAVMEMGVVMTYEILLK